MEKKERLVGNYNFSVQDTSRLIQLENFLMKYKSGIHPMTKEYMTEEAGSWNFDEEKKQLTFYIHEQMNSTYGIVLRKHIEFQFIVTETANGMTFESKKGLLTKN